MEFGEFCQTQLEIAEKQLRDGDVQLDKWGEVESKIDLSFNTLSDQYIKNIETKSVADPDDLLDPNDLSELVESPGLPKATTNAAPQLKAVVSKPEPVVSSMNEIKSEKMKNSDRGKHGKHNRNRGGTSVQDSREESLSGDDSSNIDDSQDQAIKKGGVPLNNKSILPREVLKNYEEDFLNDGDPAVLTETDGKKVKLPEETIDNTHKFTNVSKFKYGVLKLEDKHVRGVLNELERNTTFQGKLGISDQNLTDQSLLKISKILFQPLPHIQELHLQGNTRFGTQGLSELAESVGGNTHLQVLKIGGITCGFEAER